MTNPLRMKKVDSEEAGTRDVVVDVPEAAGDVEIQVEQRDHQSSDTAQARQFKNLAPLRCGIGLIAGAHGQVDLRYTASTPPQAGVRRKYARERFPGPGCLTGKIALTFTTQGTAPGTRTRAYPRKVVIGMN